MSPIVPVITAPSVVTTKVGGYAVSVPAQTNCTYAWSVPSGSIDGTSNSVTLTAGTPGYFTIFCTVTDSTTHESVQGSLRISCLPEVPVLTAPLVVTTQMGGYTVSVPTQDNCTYMWSATNGSLTSVNEFTPYVFLTAGHPGEIALTCTVTTQDSHASVSGSLLTTCTPSYYIEDTTIQAKAYLWANSRLYLNQFTWVAGTTWSWKLNAPLPTIAFSHDVETSSIKVTFDSSTTVTPTGVARGIFLLGDVYVPYRHVAINDWKRARILNHTLESRGFDSSTWTVPTTPNYFDKLDGAGHLGLDTSTQTYSIFFPSYASQFDLNPLPDGLVLQGSDPDSGYPAGTIHGTLTEPSSTSFMAKLFDSRLSRSHFKRIAFTDPAHTSLTTANSNDYIPTKLIFDPSGFPNTNPLPSNASPNVYGSDATTSPSGGSNYVLVQGLHAPYTVSITSIFVQDIQRSSVAVSDVFTSGTSGGATQFYLGVDSDATRSFTSSSTQGTTGGLGWEFTVPSQKLFIRSLNNAGGIKVPYSTLVSHGPYLVTLALKVIDIDGVSITKSIYMYIKAAPAMPAVRNPQHVVHTGTRYGMTLGTTSDTVSGYPYNEYNAVSLFHVDRSLWTPTLKPHFIGAWEPASNYIKDDLVIKDDVYYLALAQSLGSDPAVDTVAWVAKPSSFDLNLAPFALDLACVMNLPQSSAITPVLSERFPTFRSVSNPWHYDYIETTKSLDAILVAGDLQIGISAQTQGDANSTTSLADGDSLLLKTLVNFNVIYTVVGGTPPYTWTCLWDGVAFGTSVIPNIETTTTSADNSTFIIAGARVPTPTDVIPETHQVIVTVMDSSSAAFVVQKTATIDLMFTSSDIADLNLTPYLASDLRFECSSEEPVAHKSAALTYANFPWVNTSSYDYLNDYPEGLLPGAAPRGFFLDSKKSVTLKVTNKNPDYWRSFRYAMPMGLNFGLQKFSTGGYKQVDSYQIANIVSSDESLVKYTTSGYTPVDSSTLLHDSNEEVCGFTLTTELSVGDIITIAAQKHGASLSNFWELGYMLPHFELLTPEQGATVAPRDAYATLLDTYGRYSSLGVGSFYADSFSSSNRSSFIQALTQGDFKQGFYKTTPEIGSGSDPLEIEATMLEGKVVINSELPISENTSSKFWVAGSNIWKNTSYYWLGGASSFSTGLDLNSRPIYFGFTECDRLLKRGVFPDSTSILTPSVQAMLVNFYTVDSSNVEHTLDLSIHGLSSTPSAEFITKLRSYFSLATAPGPTGDWDYISKFINDPSLDPLPKKYFLGPKSTGSKIPGGASTLVHPTITRIDRGFRVDCEMDSTGLFSYLRSVGMVEGDSIYLLFMFLVTRPNINLSSAEARLFLDIDGIAAASGLTQDQITNTSSPSWLRGKSYARVPIQMKLTLGSDNTILPDPTSSAPSLYITS